MQPHDENRQVFGSLNHFLVINVLERVVRKADQNRMFVTVLSFGGDDGQSTSSDQARSERTRHACSKAQGDSNRRYGVARGRPSALEKAMAGNQSAPASPGGFTGAGLGLLRPVGGRT